MCQIQPHTYEILVVWYNWHVLLGMERCVKLSQNEAALTKCTREDRVSGSGVDIDEPRGGI